MNRTLPAPAGKRRGRWPWRWLVAAGGLLVLGCAALLLLFRPLWYAPVEMNLVKIEPVEIADDDGRPMSMVSVQVRNRDAARIAFARAEISVEARCEGRWIALKEPWPVTGLGPRGQSTSTDLATILMPAGADACRFDLAYYFWSYPNLPFQIHDGWARRNAKSPATLQLQKVIWAISPRFFDWLWPVQSVQYTSRLQHRRQTYALKPETSAEPSAGL